VLHTAHGDVPTPAFMPVGTQASVKALDPADLRAMNAKIVLSNTYHLYLRPGPETVDRMGGLAKFMAWNGPTLTDSGGFQGFSLEHLRKITDDGIVFKSHIDGSFHEFTPEAVMRHQRLIGADIIMPIDICAPSKTDRAGVEYAVEQTYRWAVRCRAAHGEGARDWGNSQIAVTLSVAPSGDISPIKGETKRTPEQPISGTQHLFGIVQGGLFPDLRERSVQQITSLDFPGYSIGGLSVGESKREMYDIVSSTAPLLPADRARYLMGVGSPEDLVECVARGIDMFDCVLPTRIARNSALFSRAGRINIDTAQYRAKDAPIEDGCDCYTCRTFTAGYVNHLFRTKELLAYRLASIHNVRFILHLMEEMRNAILAGTFGDYRKAFHEQFVPPDEKARHSRKQKWVEAQRKQHERQA